MSKGPHTRRSRGFVGPVAPPKVDRFKSSEEERQAFLSDRERVRDALAMWGRKVTYREIGNQLGCSAYTAFHLVKRGLEVMDTPDAQRRRVQENEALDQLERITWSVLARPGYRISNSGRIVFEPEIAPDGRQVPMPDQSVRVAAIGKLLNIQERRARLNGLDMPVRIDLTTVNLDAALMAVELLEREADKQEREVIEAQHRGLPPGRE